MNFSIIDTNPSTSAPMRSLLSGVLGAYVSPMAENTMAAPPKNIPIGTPKVGIHPSVNATAAKAALSFGSPLAVKPLFLNSANLCAS